MIGRMIAFNRADLQSPTRPRLHRMQATSSTASWPPEAAITLSHRSLLQRIGSNRVAKRAVSSARKQVRPRADARIEHWEIRDRLRCEVPRKDAANARGGSAPA